MSDTIKDGSERKNPFEALNRKRLAVYRKAKEILDQNPDKFAANVYNNDYYSAIVTVTTHASYEKDSGELTLSIHKLQERGKDLTEQVTVSKANKVIYRLDVRAGAGIQKEKDEMQSKLETDEVSDQAQNMFKELIEGRFMELDGNLAVLESNWAETEVSEDDVLEFLSRVDNFSLPKRMAGYPTWQTLRGNIAGLLSE